MLKEEPACMGSLCRGQVQIGCQQLTPPRPAKVIDPEKDLEGLYKDFVGGIAHRGSTRTLRRHIGERLMSAGLDRKIKRDIKVTVPVIQEEVEIPFGFRNGRFNLINPVRFEATNPQQSLNTAFRYAVEGRSLYQTPDPKLGELKLVVVGKFRSHDRALPAKVERVFAENNVTLFRTTELPKLIDEIRQTGRDIDGLASQ